MGVDSQGVALQGNGPMDLDGDRGAYESMDLITRILTRGCRYVTLGYIKVNFVRWELPIC